MPHASAACNGRVIGEFRHVQTQSDLTFNAERDCLQSVNDTIHFAQCQEKSHVADFCRDLVRSLQLHCSNNRLLAQSVPKQSRHSASKPSAQPAASKISLSVRDFGAKGDATTNDTAAFQTALDRCAALGGGEVLLPAGDYLIGGIQLRSNTTLRLDAGATLRGTPNFDEYAVSTVRWEGKWIPGHVALIYAIDAQNVGIIGAGKIIGNPALAGRPRPDAPLRHPALIEFIRCNGIHLEGFSTEYKSMWSVHPTSSENITIKNLTIRSTRRQRRRHRHRLLQTRDDHRVRHRYRRRLHIAEERAWL